MNHFMKGVLIREFDCELNVADLILTCVHFVEVYLCSYNNEHQFIRIEID